MILRLVEAGESQAGLARKLEVNIRTLHFGCREPAANATRKARTTGSTSPNIPVAGGVAASVSEMTQRSRRPQRQSGRTVAWTGRSSRRCRA